MKQIISFEKEIAFKTMIGEVTSISLEHTLSFQGPSTISGDMIVSGTYKMTEASTLEEDFQYAIPVDIMLTKELEEDNRSITIHNFTYDIRNEDTLHLYIDVLVKGREVIELEEDEEEVTREEYGLIDGISIDFGVMQRTRKAYVIKGDFKWDDIGSFNALSRYLNEYRNNKISNNVYIQDCENCSIFGGNEKLIIGFGVKDLVVVDAGDVILVMDKDKDQEIKHLLNDINETPEFGAFI